MGEKVSTASTLCVLASSVSLGRLLFTGMKYSSDYVAKALLVIDNDNATSDYKVI